VARVLFLPSHGVGLPNIKPGRSCCNYKTKCAIVTGKSKLQTTPVHICDMDIQFGRVRDLVAGTRGPIFMLDSGAD
jgi:hypothetical protein